MDTITSAEFRKRYAKLSQPTVVTVNGHTLGIWQPADDETRVTLYQPPPMPHLTPITAKQRQAERDRILHGINKGK